MIRVALAASVAVLGALATFGDRETGHTGRPERVRITPSPIVWIASGEFTMGATSDQAARAIRRCETEPYVDNVLVVRLCLGALFSPSPDQPNVCDGQPSDSPMSLVHELGAHRVWLAGFGVDRTEVTVAAYERAVSSGACGAARVGRGTPQYGGDTQPIVGVTWDDAQAYCRARGGRLPSEAEWERAARGRDDRPYPWGWQWDPRRANHGALRAASARVDAGGCFDADDGFALTAPVGSYPDGASPDGVLDMAGNAWEWTADLWHDPESGQWHDSESRYPDGGNGTTAVSVAPRGASHGAGHVIRGGGFDWPAVGLRTTFRWRQGAATRSLSLGFRCAYDVVRGTSG